VTEITPYLLVGMIMWVAVLKSGVHATLAGVILAMFIPLRDRDNPKHSPLRELEHDLHKTVAFGILPIFAFANSGISFTGLDPSQFLHPVPVGVAAGLFIGKQLGVFIFCWLAIALGITKLPEGVNWWGLYGTALLCGVGFTMSLFIGSLAFEQTDAKLLFDERLGIIMGSVISGTSAYLVLHWSLAKNDTGTNHSTP
jgi:NhaA family Na+:H+ antiporter